MKSDLYLFNPSFSFDDNTTLDQISERIENLLISIEDIRKEIYKNKIDEDRFLKNEEIYEVKLYKNLLVLDFLYGCPSEDCKQINSIVRNALRSIIDKYSKSSDLSEQEIVQLVKNNNESRLSGLICLNSIELEDISPNNALNTKNDWYNFHRFFLAQNPLDESHFFKEIQKYFPQIYFHPHVENSLKSLEGGLDKFAGPIIHNLIQLNDKFSSYPVQSSLNDVLRMFSRECNVDATLEGDIRRKPELTFDFADANSNKVFSVYCEPHLKLSKSSLLGDTHHYFNRIYFHLALPDVNNGRILVGHIGAHL